MSNLTFTGERAIPNKTLRQTWVEHTARYRWASHYIIGKHVIDLGCGQGYGTAALSRRALSIIGVDCSAEAIADAQRCYPWVSFLQADVQSVPLPSASFDCCAAFEIVEHLARCDLFLSEVHRLLRSGGLLLMSIPMSNGNPFHIRQWTFSELEVLLKDLFTNVLILHQHGTDISMEALDDYRIYMVVK